MVATPSLSKSQRDVRDLFGVPIDAMTMPEVLALVDETINRRGRLKIGLRIHQPGDLPPPRRRCRLGRGR